MNRKEYDYTSLSEVHQSVDTTSLKRTGWRRILAFFGPAYLVSVGYMDPGNWATDIAGGSKYGYSLIWVLLMSNLMAVLLQGFCARLGIVAGQDLAQASRSAYNGPVNYILYFLAEIAIAACDLAEVVGMAIGLNLLTGLPLIYGVLISLLDTFLLLFLMRFGIRKLEAFVLVMISVIGLSFFIQIWISAPEAASVMKGFVPSLPDDEALYIATGIIGATVMPHNLYLHSSLVQTRRFGKDASGMKKAIKFNFIDTVISLNLAFFVNCAILVLAAATFYRSGLYEVAEIQDAHRLLEPLLGSSLAPVLFAVALIAAGQSSTVTGTLAGQIIMEGHIHLRIQPWLRRIITRLLAIIPAVLTIVLAGEEQTGKLLVLSQVILSLQLGFAVIPLLHAVSDHKKMGEFAVGGITKSAGWVIALIIIALNVKMVAGQLSDWEQQTTGGANLAVRLVAIPLAIGLLMLLVYLALKPLLKAKDPKSKENLHGEFKALKIAPKKPNMRIAVCVDFSEQDREAISYAVRQGGKDADYLLIHVVETVGAMVFGGEAGDRETAQDKAWLDQYVKELSEYRVASTLGFGGRRKAIVKAVTDFEADLLVMGAHGHKGLKDLIFGTTVDGVRHDLDIPVLIVK